MGKAMVVNLEHWRGDCGITLKLRPHHPWYCWVISPVVFVWRCVRLYV